MSYEWTDVRGNRYALVDVDRPMEWQQPGCAIPHMVPVCRMGAELGMELLRLAEENAALRAENAELRKIAAALVPIPDGSRVLYVAISQDDPTDTLAGVPAVHEDWLKKTL